MLLQQHRVIFFHDIKIHNSSNHVRLFTITIGLQLYFFPVIKLIFKGNKYTGEDLLYRPTHLSTNIFFSVTKLFEYHILIHKIQIVIKRSQALSSRL